MVYEGDVRPNIGTIDFASSTYYCHVGRAFYAEKPQLWDSASGRLTDFSTRFSLSTHGTSWCTGLAWPSSSPRSGSKSRSIRLVAS
ncbi:hypothetical protein NL676_022691 [Syzygium grande]|nr:hypothetical protein NL676_022691 [Syzygium grande]